MSQSNYGVSDDTNDSESKASHNSSSQSGDNMSILRFIRGNKSKRLEISASGKVTLIWLYTILITHLYLGLSLKYHKASTSKVDKNQTNPDGEELVLTNMAFYTGLHLWEIIAPISCNSMCK